MKKNPEDEFVKMALAVIEKADPNLIPKSTLPNGLTVKEFIFAESYLANGGDAKKALETARGNSLTEQEVNKKGSRADGEKFLSRAKVAEYILNTVSKKLRIARFTADEVVGELIDLAMFNIKDAVSWDGNSVTYKSSEEIPDSIAKCIKSVNEIKIAGGHKMVRVDFHDKLKPLDTLTKLMGLQQETILHKHVQVPVDELEDEASLKLSLTKAGLLGKIVEMEPEKEKKEEILELKAPDNAGNLA